MNRTYGRDLLVGLFVLAGLLSLGYLSLRLGGLSLSKRETVRCWALFEEIGGVKPRAPVVISGVKVGEVEEIGLSDDYRARVTFRVRADVPLPVDTTASIFTSGVLGDQYISLAPGAEEATLRDGDPIGLTESAVILERVIGHLIHNVKGEN